VRPSACLCVPALTMTIALANVFDEPEELSFETCMAHEHAIDYLSFFESPVEHSIVSLPEMVSPTSGANSPSPTQQFDIGSFFQKSVEPRQLFATGMAENELQMFTSPKASMEKKEVSLKGILFASLVREGLGHMLVANHTRHRVRTKSAHPEMSLRRLLHEDGPFDDPVTGTQRQKAMQEAMRCVSVELRVPFRIARHQVRSVWNTLPNKHRNLWVVKKDLKVKTMEYDKGVGWKRKDDQDAADLHLRPQRTGMDVVAVTALGFIATWFTKLGVDHPAVIRWVQEGLRGDELKERLLTVDVFKTHFEVFNSWVLELGKTFCSCAPACSMEMCYESKHACQIHLHAFFGPEVNFRGWVRKPTEMTPTWKQLQWCGVLPHLEALRGSGQNAIEKAARRGLYYITMDKVGMLFRASKAWPHEDRVSTLASITS
jgi:hypothetical protein